MFELPDLEKPNTEGAQMLARFNLQGPFKNGLELILNARKLIFKSVFKSHDYYDV